MSTGNTVKSHVDVAVGARHASPLRRGGTSGEVASRSSSRDVPVGRLRLRHMWAEQAPPLLGNIWNEGGVSYVMVLFTIAVLGTVSLSFALMTGLQRDVASNYASNAEAHYLARAGLNVGIWRFINEPGFVDTYDGQPLSRTFQGMTVEYMVEKAQNNESILVTSTGTVASAIRVLRHLIIPPIEDAAEPACIVAYGEGSQQAPRYRTWDGAAWSDEAMGNSVSGAIRWAVLKSCPVRSEKMLGTLDQVNHTYVQVWDGSAWGPVTQLTSGGDTSSRTFDIAYESDSGDALIVYRRAFLETDVYYRTWNGSQLSGETMLDLPTWNWPKKKT